MAFTSYKNNEVNCKVVYFGPSRCGKTANLRAIYAQTSHDQSTSMISEDDDNASTAFFDFLPVSLGKHEGFHVKVHLYTLPNEQLYPTTPRVILKGIDGLVFVADSRVDMLEDNVRAHQQMKDLLARHNISYSEIPKIYQYNRRDSVGALPVSSLSELLNHTHAPEIEAVATQSKGTLETVQLLAKQLMTKLQGPTT